MSFLNKHKISKIIIDKQIKNSGIINLGVFASKAAAAQAILAAHREKFFVEIQNDNIS